ncbi:hypothetical protein VE03_10158, partial [Pseudogymnoascus sp. 23342-1-I1]
MHFLKTSMLLAISLALVSAQKSKTLVSIAFFVPLNEKARLMKSLQGSTHADLL